MNIAKWMDQYRFVLSLSLTHSASISQTCKHTQRHTHLFIHWLCCLFCQGGERNWIQVLCNGGVATEVAILYMIDCGCGEHVTDFTKHYTQSWLGMALLGAVSCSCADTLASEIGTVVGGWDPRLVTTFRRVPKGETMINELFCYWFLNVVVFFRLF